MRWLFQIFLSAVIFEKNWSQDIIFPTDEGTAHVSGNIGNPGQPAVRSFSRFGDIWFF